jgi:hypothetical protein
MVKDFKYMLLLPKVAKQKKKRKKERKRKGKHLKDVLYNIIMNPDNEWYIV